MTYVIDEKRFMGDVASHQMTIIRDDGVSRHIRFAKPGTMCMHFDLITWPGYLCYTGDMGTYVFRRLQDMFEFFRTERSQPKNGQALFINPSYWGEKLEAVDRADGYKEYSADKFRRNVADFLDAHEASVEVREAVSEDVIYHADDGRHEAMRAALDFTHESGFEFTDFWEYDPMDYSYRFIWCCYALGWGIQKYDDAKVEAANA